VARRWVGRMFEIRSKMVGVRSSNEPSGLEADEENAKKG
jgi:hypothetical protein